MQKVRQTCCAFWHADEQAAKLSQEVQTKSKGRAKVPGHTQDMTLYKQVCLGAFLPSNISW